MNRKKRKKLYIKSKNSFRFYCGSEAVKNHSMKNPILFLMGKPVDFRDGIIIK